MNEAELLQLAKRGLSPSSADAERVRTAVQRAIVGGIELREASSATKPALTTAAKLGALLVLAAASGSAGYWLGYDAGSAAHSRQAASAPPRRQTPAPPVVASEETIPAPTPPAAPPLANVAPRAVRAAPSASSPAPAASGESSLEVETRFVARVERALRSQNPRLALGLLGELDRTVPGGQLVEERQLGRVVAHCQLGSESASTLAREFAQRFPTSPSAARVKQACGDETDAGSPDTH